MKNGLLDPSAKNDLLYWRKATFEGFSSVAFLFIYFNDFERERGREREKHRPVAPRIHAFIDWLPYVPGLEMELAALVLGDNAPTSGATQPALFKDYHT